MTIAGLIGGLGPESTIDYYRRILATWREHDPGSAPALLIDSLDVTRGLQLVEHDRPGLTRYLAESVERLARAGVDFVALTANTAHVVFDDLAVNSPVPLLSIVECCAQVARTHGHRRLGLLGTRFTMEAPFYPAVLGRSGIQVVSPIPEERTEIHARYVGELLKGVFTDDARDLVRGVVARLQRDHGIDGVILGGTELPLLLDAPMVGGLPTLDTTAIHVAAIVARLRGARDPRVNSPTPPETGRARTS